MTDMSKYRGTRIERTYEEIIKVEFKYLINYLNEKEINHREKNSLISEWFDNREDEEFVDILIDDHYELQRFEQILYSSQLILIYSKVEFWIGKIARILEQNYNINNQIKENSDLIRAKKFIVNVIKVQIPNLDLIWQQLMEYKEIRNFIVHNNNNLFKHQIVIRDQNLFSDDVLKGLAIINKNTYLNTDLNNGDIEITSSNYLLDFCNLAQNFLITTLHSILKTPVIDPKLKLISPILGGLEKTAIEVTLYNWGPEIKDLKVTFMFYNSDFDKYLPEKVIFTKELEANQNLISSIDIDTAHFNHLTDIMYIYAFAHFKNKLTNVFHNQNLYFKWEPKYSQIKDSTFKFIGKDLKSRMNNFTSKSGLFF